MLAERYGVAADTWAVTSWTNLRTDALEAERWNRLHPEAEPACPTRHRRARRRARSGGRHHRLHAGRARPGVALRGAPLHVARDRRVRPFRRRGTPCAAYFEVDAAHLVVAVLQQLARGGRLDPAIVSGAIADLGVDPGRVAPFTL